MASREEIDRYHLRLTVVRDRQIPELRELVERLERLAWELVQAVDTPEDILEIIATLKDWLSRLEERPFWQEETP